MPISVQLRRTRLNAYKNRVWIDSTTINANIKSVVNESMDELVNSCRPINNWTVLYTPTWADKLAQSVGGWEVGSLVLFGKHEDFVSCSLYCYFIFSKIG